MRRTAFASKAFAARLFCLVAAFTILTIAIAGCGGGGGTTSTQITTTVTSVTVTPTTGTVTAGGNASFVATVAGQDNPSQVVTWSVTPTTAGTITGGVFTSSSTITVITTATIMAASTVPGYTNITGSSTVTINPATVPQPTVTIAAVPSAITLGATTTLTWSSTNTTSCTASGAWSGTEATSGSTTETPVATGTATYTLKCTGPSGSATASANVTVNAATIQLTSISPPQWCVGECAFITFTFYGANFADGDMVSCTPDPNIQLVQLINSGEAEVTLGIDQIHEGSGYRQCKVCKGDGTGCSATAPLGLYSQNMCASYPKTGETFCLNPQEAIAGQNLFNGQPLNGYVDKFTASGAPDGNFFVGAPECCIAVDDVTGLVVIDGGLSDQNGGRGDVPGWQGMYPDPAVADAAKNGWACLLQPTAPNDLSCYPITGSAFSEATVLHVNVGTNPQSLAMGVTGGKTYAYVLTVGGGTPTIWSVDVSDGMTNVVSQPIVDITTGAPGGSGITMFDSLGVGVVTSYGDNLAIRFSETTLKPTGGTITSPEASVNVIADAADGITLIGTADPANSGGTFTKVNSATGTATAIPGKEAPMLPVGVVVNPAGGSFQVCPSSADGTRTPCSTFSIPK